MLKEWKKGESGGGSVATDSHGGVTTVATDAELADAEREYQRGHDRHLMDPERYDSSGRLNPNPWRD